MENTSNEALTQVEAKEAQGAQAPTPAPAETTPTQAATATASTPDAPEPTAPAVPKPEEPPVPEIKTEPSAAAEDITAVKGENYAMKLGVKAEYAADAVVLARSRVKDGVTLEQAVDNVVKEYPFLKGAELPSMTPSVSISNDSAPDPDDATVNRIMGIK